MTFKHKLSRRLALLRNVVLLGALSAVAGCDLRQLLGLLQGVVVTVSVDPAAASVIVGQTVQLTATPRDSSGNPLSGGAVTWATNNAPVATVNGSGLVTGAGAGSAIITATSESKSGTAAITVTTSVTNPGVVTNLAVVGVTATSVTLSFTETADGAGQPASYEVRFAVAPLSWGSATSVAQGSCAVPLAGTAIGATRSCTVLGLAPATAYQFQLVAFRGALNVNAVFGALSNVASGTTAASTAPVASVTVSPASASLLVGATQQLTATLKDANGNTLTGRSVTWTSSAPLVAPVSGSGLVSALAAGLATITATSEGKSGTAALTVTASGSPSVDTVFADDFESGTLSAWQDGVDPTRHRVVTDPSFAQSGSRYLEVTYPAGGEGGWLTHWFMPGYDSVYVSYYVRFAANWQGSTKLIALYGSRTDNQWSAFGQAGNCPTGTDFFATMLVTDQTGNPGQTRFYTYYPAMAREPDGVTCWGRYGDGRETYVPPLALSLGVWHRVEFWVKLNTPGQANASQTFWLDGVQRGTWSGISLRSSDILRLNSVQLTFSSGGVPQTQQLYVDHLVVATARP